MQEVLESIFPLLPIRDILGLSKGEINIIDLFLGKISGNGTPIFFIGS